MPRTSPPRPPVPPAETAAAGPDLESEGLYERLVFDDADLIGRFAQSVEFAQCRFRAARLAGSALPKARLTDCLIERSDFSNLRIENGSAERVAARDCRMTGLACNGAVLRDVTFTDCKLDLTNWRAARLDAVTFAGCNLSGADFTGADLRGAHFTDCDLTGAQFSGATMRGARFQHCDLSGIGGITSWQGAIIHPGDLPALSYTLAGALGIIVEKT
ncbi:hypothetical protein FHR83_009010 [Actinoplanes campanulatus]|uniref:Pentapeptide repeat-containing protein n=1 Tax=Actinoplanes campanulatus TaxID=113559 RepID=A0A7W5ARU9_9ACTN|nr:pentapeptide repeat-containing protein [Actinoplanes campanulatus]MBB3101282.1 hypothetical protein [Actinoplanes campanulatus]GGN50761.1 hypothetical protein GCM10010109_90280 [Actinoplanes campanulatus]GID42165.1 hypothetical protein Aca09nite_86710 [Actinoplanes campanulatus]